MSQYTPTPTLAIICSFCNKRTELAVRAPEGMLKRNGEQKYICAICIEEAKELCDNDLKSNK